METFVFALRLQQLRRSALHLRLQTHNPKKRTVAECVLSLRQLGPEESEHWLELNSLSKSSVRVSLISSMFLMSSFASIALPVVWCFEWWHALRIFTRQRRGMGLSSVCNHQFGLPAEKHEKQPISWLISVWNNFMQSSSKTSTWRVCCYSAQILETSSPI